LAAELGLFSCPTDMDRENERGLMNFPENNHLFTKLIAAVVGARLELIPC
jgi:hypothetical protein